MAIDLSNLERPTGQRPVILTLFGEGGMGKTTLAAMFPKPVFIRTEDGTASLQGNDDVAMFPLASSSADVLDAIESLATQDHEFKTLVLDSVTQLATIIEHEIVAADPKANQLTRRVVVTGLAIVQLPKSTVRFGIGLVRLLTRRT